MQSFADLTIKFEKQEKEHTEVVYKLERKAVVDKDRWEVQADPAIRSKKVCCVV